MPTVTRVQKRPIRRLTLGVLGAALAVVGWTMPLASVANAGTASATATTSGCVATRATMIRVTIVIDSGAGTPESTCVTLPVNAKGSAALNARADQLGRPRPRYDDSGLLCAIDGSPASGCGEPAANGGYQYWSYWLASGNAWNYATVGPGGRTLSDGAIDGWRFLVGGGTSADHAPRVPPVAVCETPPSPTSTVAPPSGSGSPNTTPNTNPAPPSANGAPDGNNASALAVPARPGRPPASVQSATSIAGDPATTVVDTTPSPAAGSADPPAADGSATPSPESNSSTGTPAEIAVSTLAATADTSSDTSSNGKWTLIGGAVIVLAIGAGLLTRSRRSVADE